MSGAAEFCAASMSLHAESRIQSSRGVCQGSWENTENKNRARVPAQTSEFFTSKFGEQKTENSLPNSVQKSEIRRIRIHQLSKIVYDCGGMAMTCCGRGGWRERKSYAISNKGQ